MRKFIEKQQKFDGAGKGSAKVIFSSHAATASTNDDLDDGTAAAFRLPPA
jgi:hypothetical protein